LDDLEPLVIRLGLVVITWDHLGLRVITLDHLWSH